jgi:hypothetical protein
VEKIENTVHVHRSPRSGNIRRPQPGGNIRRCRRHDRMARLASSLLAVANAIVNASTSPTTYTSSSTRIIVEMGCCGFVCSVFSSRLRPTTTLKPRSFTGGLLTEVAD